MQIPHRYIFIVVGIAQFWYNSAPKNERSLKWLEDIKRKHYDISGLSKLLNDLKGVIGFTEGDRWFIKTMKEEKYLTVQ